MKGKLLIVLFLVLGVGVGVVGIKNKQSIYSRAASTCSGTWKCVKGTSSSPAYECSRFNGMTENSCTGGGNGQGNYCVTGWSREDGCTWSGGATPTLTPTSTSTPTPTSKSTPTPTGNPKTCDNSVKIGDTACNHNGDTVQYRCANPGSNEQWRSEDCDLASGQRCHGTKCQSPCSGKIEGNGCDFDGNPASIELALCQKDDNWNGVLFCKKREASPGYCVRHSLKLGDDCIYDVILWGVCKTDGNSLKCGPVGDVPACITPKTICTHKSTGILGKDRCDRRKYCLYSTRCTGPDGSAKCK